MAPLNPPPPNGADDVGVMRYQPRVCDVVARLTSVIGLHGLFNASASFSVGELHFLRVGVGGHKWFIFSRSELKQKLKNVSFFNQINFL